MNRILFFFILLYIPCLSIASDTLTLVNFQELVLNNHPLIKSADLYNEIAASYLLKGQGILDPKFYSDFDGKQFKDQNYFKRWNSEVKIPTKFPIDIAFGYENNTGDFLNNENLIPSNGLLYGQINISLLRGLLFDEQRFALRESKLLAEKSQTEKELVVRNIITQSLQVYVNWSMAYREMDIVQSYLNRVTERHNFVIQLFENGDKPAIDTIESRTNLNTATKAQISAKENLLQKKQKLNMFLWTNNGEPLALKESVIPQNITFVTKTLFTETRLITQYWDMDPIIRKKQIEVEQINLENRLEREQLKPQLDLKLNTIHSLGDNTLSYSYSPNDYKIGASFVVPIRNRKIRGQIKMNEAFIDQNKLDQDYYLSELKNNHDMLNLTQNLNQEALGVSEEKVENSNLLLSAEKLKFELGESSVFLLNSRERKLLEAETEYLKTLKKLCYTYTELYFLKMGQENQLN